MFDACHMTLHELPTRGMSMKPMARPIRRSAAAALVSPIEDPCPTNLKYGVNVAVDTERHALRIRMSYRFGAIMLSVLGLGILVAGYCGHQSVLALSLATSSTEQLQNGPVLQGVLDVPTGPADAPYLDPAINPGTLDTPDVLPKAHPEPDVFDFVEKFT